MSSNSEVPAPGTISSFVPCCGFVIKVFVYPREDIRKCLVTVYKDSKNLSFSLEVLYHIMDFVSIHYSHFFHYMNIPHLLIFLPIIDI